MVARSLLIAASWVVGTIATLPDYGKWEFYSYGALSYGRLDPIISPGQVSEHVHMIMGADAFAATYDYDTLRNSSTCTTSLVQADLSNYWSPAMYHYDGASNFSLIPGAFHIYYFATTNSYSATNINGTQQRYAFPPGFTMLAGDMYARTKNYSDPASYATEFQCQNFTMSNGGVYSGDMRTYQIGAAGACPDSLRATIRFPSCWDGVADNANLTHAVYPNTNKYGDMVCPEAYPMALMDLMFEWYWPVQDFPFDNTRDDNWALSFGDTSGFGLHGDFANGWDQDFLQEAIDECDVYSLGIENCPVFSAYQDIQQPPCMPTGLYPNEDVGLQYSALTALPGCNPLWTDNSTKPTCAVTPPTPAIDKYIGPNTNGWNYISCPLWWQSGGVILNEHYMAHWANMTVDSCLAYCAAGNYTYAMPQFGTSCFCDNEIRNNGSIVTSLDWACQWPCAANYLEYCGGNGAGMLYEACTGSACTTSIPSMYLAWTSTTASTSTAAANATSSGTAATTTKSSTSAAKTTSSSFASAGSSKRTTTAKTSASSTVTSAALKATTTALRCGTHVTPKGASALSTHTGSQYTADPCAVMCMNTHSCTGLVITGTGQNTTCSLYAQTPASAGSVAAPNSLYYNIGCFQAE